MYAARALARCCFRGKIAHSFSNGFDPLATGWGSTAVTAVAPGGVLAWEAFTAGARRARPGLCPQWCLADGEPVSLLGTGFEVLEVRDLPDGGRGPKRALLARRVAAHGRP